MAFGWAGAGAGAADSLEEILVRKRLEQQQRDQAAVAEAQLELQRQAAQQRATEFSTEMGHRARTFEADQDERKANRERQGRLDAQTEADRRQVENQRGVRRMIGDFLVQRGSQPLDAGSRQTLQGMAVQEDVDLPTTVTRDPEAEFQERKRVIDLQHRNQLSAIAAQGRESRATATARTAGTTTSTPYANERASRTIGAVDALLGKVNRWTAGAGSVLSGIPETDARDFKAQLDTLKSNIAFNELAQMREASKTGGALGAVSERELALLESALGALDQGQSPESLKAQLQQVKESVQRWQAASASRQPRIATDPYSDAALGSRGGFQVLDVLEDD